MGVLSGRFGVEGDQIVDTEDRDGSLSGELERLDLADSRLNDTSLKVVSDLSGTKVESRSFFFFPNVSVSNKREKEKDKPSELLGGLIFEGLGSVVVGTELSNEVGGILGSVDGEGLGDDEEGLSELGDGELLSGTKGVGKGLEVDGEGGLDGSTSGDDAIVLEGSLDDAQDIMDGSLHLIEHIFVGSSKDDRGGLFVFTVLCFVLFCFFTIKTMSVYLFFFFSFCCCFCK